MPLPAANETVRPASMGGGWPQMTHAPKASAAARPRGPPAADPALPDPAGVVLLVEIVGVEGHLPSTRSRVKRAHRISRPPSLRCACHTATNAPSTDWVMLG